MNHDLLEIEIPFEEFDINPDLEAMFDDAGVENLDTALGSTRITTQSAKLRRYPRTPMHSVGYRNARELADQTPDLDPGEAFYCVVAGSFIFGDYLEALAVQKNYLIDELIIATLSLGKENADSLHNLVKGNYVRHVNLIVSDYWYAHEHRSKKGGVSYLHHVFGDQLTLAAAGLHTKVTLMKTRCGKHLALHGSANLRSSQNLEQFCVENNPDLYAFNRGWMSRILDHYATTGDRLRGNAIWQNLTEPTPKTD